MKIIEVMNMVAEGKVKKGTKFIVGKRTYTFNGDIFILEQSQFGGNLLLSARDLNQEVELIQPKPKKYHLRLNKDSLNYIGWDRGTSYEFTKRDDFFGYQTKFTQKEIDDNEFLKFVEKYGVKEEVKNDED